MPCCCCCCWCWCCWACACAAGKRCDCICACILGAGSPSCAFSSASTCRWGSEFCLAIRTGLGAALGDAFSRKGSPNSLSGTKVRYFRFCRPPMDRSCLTAAAARSTGLSGGLFRSIAGGPIAMLAGRPVPCVAAIRLLAGGGMDVFFFRFVPLLPSLLRSCSEVQASPSAPPALVAFTAGASLHSCW